MEIQILELRKLPEKMAIDGNAVLSWMKFFSARTKREFEDMARTNEYMEEAYSTLLELSADEKKRMEYEAREKALRDYNSQMKSAFERGMEQGVCRGIKEGEQRGRKEGIERTRKIFRMYAQGKQPEEIADICGMEAGEINDILFGE